MDKSSQKSKIHNHPENGCIYKILEGHLIEENYDNKLRLVGIKSLFIDRIGYIDDFIHLHRMNNYKNNEVHKEDPFSKMGFVKFWVLSLLFFSFFPLSLLILVIVIGPIKTKLFISALIKDFFQTIMILLISFSLIIWGMFQLLKDYI